MIVCSCNVLSDHDVRAALAGKEKPRTTNEVYGCLGCSPRCGRCRVTIRSIMDQAMAVAQAPQPEDGQARPDGCMNGNNAHR
jgi:bacterioferritin-associated ferredoxin